VLILNDIRLVVKYELVSDSLPEDYQYGDAQRYRYEMLSVFAKTLFDHWETLPSRVLSLL